MHKVKKAYRTRRWAVASALALTGGLVPVTAASGASAPSGNTLVAAYPAIASSLDPGVFPGLSYLYGIPQTEGTLLQYAPVKSKSGRLDSPSDVVPDLATSYKLTKAGIVLTLSSAKAPDGDVLTPQDVQWTFQREIGVADPVGAFYMSIAGYSTKDPVTILGPHTVRINGNITPLGLIPLLNAEFSPLDEKLVKEHTTSSDPWGKNWLSTHSATFGPYQVTTFKPNSEAILQANPYYDAYGGKPGYSKVIMEAPSASLAEELLRAGSVQYVETLSLSQASSLQKDSKVKVVVVASSSQDVMVLNQKYAPLANPDVRRAMSMALDRSAIVEGAYLGIAKPAYSVVPYSIPGVSGTSRYYKYNLAAAKQLLATTPYKSGFSMDLEYNSAETSGVDDASLALYVQSELKALGINVTVTDVASDPEFRSGEEAGKYDSWFLAEGPVAADTDYLFNLYHVTKAESNFGGESNSVIDSLVAQAATLPIGAQRTALMDKAVAIWNGQMYDLPIAQDEDAFGYASNVCGQYTSQYQGYWVNNLHPCS